MFNLEALDVIIAERAGASDGTSYTASLMARGTGKCAQKLGEEAVETVIAAMSGEKEEIRKEAADLLYHLLVLLRSTGVPLGDVLEELRSRTARSGLAEKASRSGTPG